MGEDGGVNQTAGLSQWLPMKPHGPESAGFQALQQQVEGSPGKRLTRTGTDSAGNFPFPCCDGPLGAVRGPAPAACFEGGAVSENIQQVYLQEATFFLPDRGFFQPVQVGGHESEEAGERLTFGSDGLGQFAGVEGMGHAFQISADGGVDAVNFGLDQAGKPLFDFCMNLNPGKRLKGGPEAPAALSGASCKSAQTAVLEGEERDDPVVVPVISG